MPTSRSRPGFSFVPVLDWLIVKCSRLGWVRIAEGLVYWCKGIHRQNLLLCPVAPGVRLWLNPHNYIDRILLAGRSHDPEVLDVLRSEVKKGDVFWDIGANIGLVSFSLMAEQPEITAVAFEPSPFTFSQLALNNLENGGQMQLLPIALSDGPEISRFTFKINRNSGQSTLRPDNQFSYDGSVPVTVESGDRLVAREIVPAPTLMKIDVEGAEWWVFSGLREILKNEALRLVIFEGPTPEQEAIEALLKENGFQSVVPLTDASQTNYLATRKPVPPLLRGAKP